MFLLWVRQIAFEIFCKLFDPAATKYRAKYGAIEYFCDKYGNKKHTSTN